MKSDLDTEVAFRGWPLGLSYEFPREQFWESVLGGRLSAIESFFHELDVDGYSLSAVFDEPEDHSGLLSLADPTTGELRETILDALAEVPQGTIFWNFIDVATGHPDGK
jgi:hypothetical protein